MRKVVNNRNYVLTKRYDYSGHLDLKDDIEILTRLSARISIDMNMSCIDVYVFCKNRGSKVYNKADKLGFYEM